MTTDVKNAWEAFETESTTVLDQLRSALTDVVAGVPGPITKPTELQRALRVDMNVCCKVLKVVSSPEGLSSGLHLPGIMAIRSFLKGARKAGVSDDVINAAVEASDAFDHLVSTHADDRTTFDSMISSLVDSEEAQQITFLNRRATYRGQRHLFGMNVRVQFKCLIVQPNEHEPSMLDLANLTGFVSLRLLRPALAPIVLSPAYTTNDDGSERTVRREPLIPTSEQVEGVALLPEFCSETTMQLHSVPAAPGRVLGELYGVGVGNTGAVTCVEGHMNRRAVPRYQEAGNKIGGHLAEIRVPCETLLLDLVIRDDTCGPLKPTASTYADHIAEMRSTGVTSPWQQVEPRQSVQHLGKGPSVLYTPDYPRYPELARHAFKHLGWDASRFDVYRCRIEYPILPSTVAMFFDLPEAPANETA